MKQFLDRNLLVKLYTDFSDSSQRIKDLLDKNDEEDAEILAHTVKGVEANPEALKPSELAANLEKAAKIRSAGDYKKMLSAFEKELKLVSDDLKTNGLYA
jgi:HPt (histidine-containing phosphotransfer) domain-containing protein